ncbi:MAG: glycosyltransferase family 25 protein [Verrucomicrobia bacterium]|nr:glycosyltransferase family 25 protein [Verrucomicrobiota bacterium]
MGIAHWITCLLLGATSIAAGEYRIEGFFQEHYGSDRVDIVTRFASRYLPYNPTIFAPIPHPHIRTHCAKLWPHSTLFEGTLPEGRIDFLWLEAAGEECALLDPFAHRIGEARVICTTISASKELISYLERRGFVLLSHWFHEGVTGDAVFVRSDLFLSAYFPSLQQPLAESYPPIHLERFFHKAPNKLAVHAIDNIDFIYMINLDERPEKYLLSAGSFAPHGIFPYRFSAVNGWKLSFEVFNAIGMQFARWLIPGRLMATVMRTAEGEIHPSHELIEESGTSYFGFGMSKGSIGIVLSHLSVLQDAYDSGFETIWVMEDDVYPTSNPWQIPCLIDKLDFIDPDWDILFTDTDTIDKQGRKVPCRALAVRPNMPMPSLESYLEQFYQVNAEFSRTGMRYGAYSMIIRRSGMEKILSHFKTYGIFLPYDMDYWLVPDLKMYTVNKEIVTTRSDALTDNSQPNYH